MEKRRKVVLAILDGFGINKSKRGNAVKLAKTPNLDNLMKHSYCSSLAASGLAVGLPPRVIGNSEVGHMNIGAGRVIYQDLVRINSSIKDKSFFSNKEFNKAIDEAIKNGTNLHIMGLISNGGVHSHINHLYALLKLCKERKFDRVFIHAFTDGRDTYTKSGINFLNQINEKCKSLGVGKIATIMGRFYAMDRDRRYLRLKKAYDALVFSKGRKTDDFNSIITRSYALNETDEFIKPIIVKNNYMPIKKNDSVIFFNFRQDRARELTRALVDPGFRKFPVKRLNLFYVCMTVYDKNIPNVHIAFPNHLIKNNLGEYLQNHHCKQIRIAETEKYAHVTFFFNGEREKEYDNEDRILVPSPKKFLTYDKKPEMSTYEIKDKVIESIESDKYDVIIFNFACSDMVGHTGNLDAAIKAVTAIDECIGKIYESSKNNNYVLVVTADHGNCEEMIDDENHDINTKHTTNQVPLIINGIDIKKLKSGKLCDIAPTILDIMDFVKPKEMTGNSLIVK